MKRFLVSVLVLSLLAVMTACGSAGPSPAASTPASTAPSTAEAPPSGEKVTLSLINNWSVATNPDNVIFKARVESFIKENPNITVENEIIPLEQYFTKVQTLAAGNDMRDLTVVWPGYKIIPFVQGGFFAPIDDLMDYFRAYLPEEKTYEYYIDGHQYAVPAKMNYTDIIYYSKSLLKDAGYDEFPASYDEFTKLVSALNAKGVIPLTIGNKDQWPLQSCLFSSIGDRLTGGDFLSGAMQGTRKFTDPDFIQALKVLQDLYKAGAFNKDLNTLDYTESTNYMLQGKTAMFMATSVVAPTVTTNNPKGADIGVALFPGVEGGKGNPAFTVGAQNTGTAISSKLEGAKKEAAYTYLKYFYSEDMYKDMIKAGAYVPATVEVSGTAPEVQQLIDLNSKGMSSVYDTVLPGSVITVLQNELQALTMGEATPDEVAKAVQAAMDKEPKP